MTKDKKNIPMKREADFCKWQKQPANKKILEMYRKSPDEIKEWLFSLTTFWADGFKDQRDEVFEMLAWKTNLMDRLIKQVGEARKVGALDATLLHYDKIVAAEKQQINLARGRIKGVEKRREKSAKNQEQLIKAIDDLFDGPEKPGWIWGNKEITTFLIKRVPDYKESTILSAVKSRAAMHRKARKKLTSL
jgi:hypothetical protein